MLFFIDRVNLPCNLDFCHVRRCHRENYYYVSRLSRIVDFVSGGAVKSWKSCAKRQMAGAARASGLRVRRRGIHRGVSFGDVQRVMLSVRDG